jgi:hypothetical protein
VLVTIKIGGEDDGKDRIKNQSREIGGEDYGKDIIKMQCKNN